MSPQPATQRRVSVDEYLAGERDAELRHEYIDGEVYAMTGASRAHALIVTALTIALGPHARERRCQLFTSDMKVKIEAAGATVFYYPDLMLVCDPTDAKPYYSAAPCMIIEVLSPATERIDRREKLLSYISLPSLQEYLLVAQDEKRIEVHRRSHGWAGETFTQGQVHVDCLGVSIPVDAAYIDVTMAN